MEQLDSLIIDDFENCFRNNCLILIGEAYSWLTINKNITIDWDEETISANIFTHIDDSEKAISWNISVSDECRLYNEAILNNKKRSKSAPRIDLKLSTNWIEKRTRVSYYIEAKNLIENNCKKATRKSLLNAKRIQARYIATGIDNFLSGGYPQNGCMLGYILEGTTGAIINHINNVLKDSSRHDEVLQETQINSSNIDMIYVSKHSNDYLLYHYFLHFSGLS